MLKSKHLNDEEYNMLSANKMEVDEIMLKCDKNHDGLIDLNEFIEGMQL